MFIRLTDAQNTTWYSVSYITFNVVTANKRTSSMAVKQARNPRQNNWTVK